MPIISNYWMRLSRIWRILQIKECVIHRGRRPRWITPSEICRILHILRKTNSIIALLFIQNIPSFLKEFRHYATLSPCFLGQQFNNLRRAALLMSFWRHRFNYSPIRSTFDVIDSIWRRCFTNLVNSIWLWWIMRVVLTNQKRENILNE